METEEETQYGDMIECLDCGNFDERSEFEEYNDDIFICPNCGCSSNLDVQDVNPINLR